MSGENFLLTTTANVYGIQRRIDVLAALQSSDDGLAPSAIVKLDCPQAVGFRFQKLGGNIVPYLYCGFPSNRLLFVGGVLSQMAGERFWDGYTGQGFLDTVGTIDNYYADAIATGLVGLITPDGQASNYWLTGYSAGGVICQLVARKLREAGYASSVLYLTGIGAPKLANREPFPISGDGESYNFICDDDPVPIIPPSVSDFQRVMGGLNIFQGQRITNFIPWPRGTNIGPTGGLSGGSSPIRLPVPPLQAIGSWLNQVNQGVLTPHSIDVYQSRILLANGPLPGTLPQAPAGPPSHVPSIPTQPEIRAAIAASQQTIFSDGTRQNANPVVIPEERLFSTKRRGKVWRVYFGDVEIAIAPKKKRALALKNEGNAFIRRLQNEGVVNADALAQQWAEYLAVASDPTSGFVPALNTEV